MFKNKQSQLTNFITKLKHSYDQGNTWKNIAHLNNSIKWENIFCQYNAKTFWNFPKLAIVVKTGIRPFNVENISTVIISDKYAKERITKQKTEIVTRLVFKDRAVAAISDATSSSSLTVEMQSSLSMVGTSSDGFELP